MSIKFSVKAKSFFKNGRRYDRQKVREQIDNLTEHVKIEARRLADKLDAGTINLTEFELGMRDLIRNGHIIAASVGRGGRARMRQRDWGRTGAKVKTQYGYLGRFVRKIPTLSTAQVAARAALYAAPIYIAYAETDRETMAEGKEKSEVRVRLVTNSEEGCDECAADEAEGWMSVDEMKELGTRECQNFCRCDLEFEDMD